MPTKPGPPVRFAACRVQVAFLLFFSPRRLSPDCFSQWAEPEDTASQSNSVFATLRDWQSRTVYEKGVRPVLCLRNRLKNRFALWPRPTPRACHQHVATCESIKMLRSLTDLGDRAGDFDAPAFCDGLSRPSWPGRRRLSTMTLCMLAIGLRPLGCRRTARCIARYEDAGGHSPPSFLVSLDSPARDASACPR